MGLLKRTSAKFKSFVKREKLFLIIAAILIAFSWKDFSDSLFYNPATAQAETETVDETVSTYSESDDTAPTKASGFEVGVFDIILLTAAIAGYASIKIYKKIKEKSHE